MICTSGTGGRQPAPGRARGRARRAAAGRASPPTGRPGCAAPTPTRPPTRSASSVRSIPTQDAADARPPDHRPGAPQRAARRAAAARVPLGAGRRRPGSAPVARDPAVTVTADARSAHRRGRRRRRRPARPGARRVRRLAAAGRAVAAAPAPAPTPSAPTGCCSPASSAPRWHSGSSGSSSAATRPCPVRSAGCSPATTSRSSTPPTRGAWSRAAVPGRRAPGRSSPHAERADDPAWLEEWHAADAARRAAARRAARRRAGPHPARGRRRGRPGAAAAAACSSSARPARSATST